jgi:short-subunit dehydrogenase
MDKQEVAMENWLQGKRVLVTGASSGIGAGLAQAFAGRGATVGICARRRDRLAQVLDRCRASSPDCRMWTVDLTDLAAVQELAGTVVDELGGVDVLVNNAGIPKRRHVTALDVPTVQQVVHLDYVSPVALTLALLPQMLERGGGRILNVSSIAAQLSSPGEAAYDAAKAALAVFSEAMAIDLWDRGVKVSIVYPGVVDTELFTLPDNDPFTAGVEAIPVDEAVAGIMEGLDAGATSIYVPGYFRDLATGKATNNDEFLAGAAEFVRSQPAAG